VHWDALLTYVYSDQDSYDSLASIDAPEIFWFQCQLDCTDDGYRRAVTVVQVQVLVNFYQNFQLERE